MKLNKSLFLSIFISQSTALNFSCSFKPYDWNNWGYRNTCFATFDRKSASVPEVYTSESKSSMHKVQGFLMEHSDQSNIRYIPRGLEKIFLSMKELYIFESKLVHLNRSDFGNYSQLEVLSISRHRLSAIPYETFEDLVNMKYFSLSHNRLTKIPNLKTMKLLKELYLHENFIQSLMADDLSENIGLKILEINENNLVRIDEKIFQNLEGLEVVNFLGNICIDLKSFYVEKSSIIAAVKEKCSEEVARRKF